jgi:DNA-binding MarR family transcriptional regulator
LSDAVALPALTAPSALTRPQRKAVVHTAPVIDAGFLQSLVGYNTRRATLVIMAVFSQRMAPFDLKPVEFSILSLIRHNPGITSRQLCGALKVQAPNLVGMLNGLQGRGWMQRQPHPSDGRSLGLHLTPPGEEMMVRAEQTVQDLEHSASSRLTDVERDTLNRLLQKIYL